MDPVTPRLPLLPPTLGDSPGMPNQHPQQCILHLDVLELILQEHKHDPFTLASSALASQSLLPIARKFLYRSVSLDYFENPYGHEQQRKLRLSLAAHSHLCGYVRTLRVSLPAVSWSSNANANAAGKGKGGGGDDETSLLDAILRQLVRLESLHLIGNGIASPNLRGLDGFRGADNLKGGRGEAGGLAGGLKKAFALASLRKVTLENIYPLEEVYVSCFTGLKHLELISVGLPVGSSPSSPSSSASISASESDSTTVVLAEPSISSTSSRSSPSLSSTTPSSSFTTSPNSASSPSEASSTTSQNSTSWYLDLPNHNRPQTSTTSPRPGDQILSTQLSDLDSGLALAQSSSTFPTGATNSPVAFSESEVLSRSNTTHGRLASSPLSSKSPDSKPYYVHLNSTPVSGVGMSYSGSGGFSGEAGRRTLRTGTRTRRSQGRVYLEYLVLNLEHLKPVLDLISSRARSSDRRARRVGQMITEGEDGEENGYGMDTGAGDDDDRGLDGEEAETDDDHHSNHPETSSSILDFSKLKQVHFYVWDPNDADGIWSILHSARKSLERLTFRHFQYTDDRLPYHLGFDNLQSLVIGTHTISIKEDPFRPLIQFFSDPMKFPSLRRLKISFDLWGCESSGATWKEVSGYRGWKELDGVLAALDNHTSPYSLAPKEGRDDGLSSSSSLQLSSIVFEIWCSLGYKGATSSGGGLLTLIQDELSYLGWNRKFMLI